jgi:hypothetical protein
VFFGIVHAVPFVKPPFTLTGRGGFFVISGSYSRARFSPQDIFNFVRKVTLHSSITLVLFTARAIKPETT